jgi:apolipoprotein N-acyltransferase
VKKGEKEIFVDGYLTREIPLSTGNTFYTLYGDLFARGNLIVAACLILMAGWEKRKNIGFEMLRRRKPDKS